MEPESQSPKATEPANLIDQIHFARRCGERPKADQLSSQGLLLAGCFATVTFIIAGDALHRAFAGGPLAQSARGAGAIVLAALTFGTLGGAWILRVVRFRRNTRGLPANDKPRRRLCCVGSPVLLLGPDSISDVPFEPASFRLITAAPDTLASGGMQGALMLLGAIGAVWLGLLVTGQWSRVGVYYLYAGVFLGAVLATVLCPTFVRVAPGRLEILHYPLFARPRVERVNLRTARLLVDLRRWVVRIEEPSREKSLDLTISLVPRRRRLAYLLFLAALSTYEPPEIAGDDLTG